MSLFRAARIRISHSRFVAFAAVIASTIGMASVPAAQALPIRQQHSIARPSKARRSAAATASNAALQAAFATQPSSSARSLASTTDSADELASAAASAGVTAEPALWTDTSRTFSTPTSENQVVITQNPINYQDQTGAWQPINDSLVSDKNAGFAWQNAADSYTAQFPANLAAGPVRVASGSSSWVSYALVGASSTPGTVDGNSITYTGALPGVDITFTATSTGVKETLTLRSALATPVISYLVNESSDLTASLAKGTVTFMRGSGADAQTFATVPQPWISDAKDSVDGYFDAITSTLAGQASGGQLLTETVAASWLAALGRAFPVTIDPSLVVGNPSASDCLMRSGSADTSYCNTGFGAVGDKADSSVKRRVVSLFPTGPLPGWALVDAADMEIYEDSLSGASTITMDAFQNNTSFDVANATWNTPNPPSGSWAGGDQTGSAVFKEQFGTATGWHDLWLTRLVQNWVDHKTDNNGLVMKADTENSSTGVLTYQDSHSTTNTPVLNVYYSARTGSDNIQTYLNRNLSDRTTLGVNPGTGNVLVTTKDMSIAGTGPHSDLKFTHYYNSQDAWLELQKQHPANPVGQLGNGWQTDNTTDASITLRNIGDGAQAVIVMPGGIQEVFVKNSATDVFDNPDGVDAKLSYDSGTGNATLVDHHTGLTYTWNIPSGSDT